MGAELLQTAACKGSEPCSWAGPGQGSSWAGLGLPGWGVANVSMQAGCPAAGSRFAGRPLHRPPCCLQGRKAKFVPGWDCHGLPIELKVLQVGAAAAAPASNSASWCMHAALGRALIWPGLDSVCGVAHPTPCTFVGSTLSARVLGFPVHQASSQLPAAFPAAAAVDEGGGAAVPHAAAAAREGGGVCAEDSGCAARAVQAVRW